MALAEVGFGALTPGAHEPVVKTGADGGTDKWNYAPRPLLYHLGAGPGGDALDDARNERVDHFFFQKFSADVDPSRAGGGNPKFSNFMVGVELKPVHQTQLLDRTHGNRR